MREKPTVDMRALAVLTLGLAGCATADSYLTGGDVPDWSRAIEAVRSPDEARRVADSETELLAPRLYAEEVPPSEIARWLAGEPASTIARVARLRLIRTRLRSRPYNLFYPLSPELIPVDGKRRDSPDVIARMNAMNALRASEEHLAARLSEEPPRYEERTEHHDLLRALDLTLAIVTLGFVQGHHPDEKHVVQVNRTPLADSIRALLVVPDRVPAREAPPHRAMPTDAVSHDGFLADRDTAWPLDLSICVIVRGWTDAGVLILRWDLVEPAPHSDGWPQSVFGGAEQSVETVRMRRTFLLRNAHGTFGDSDAAARLGECW